MTPERAREIAKQSVRYAMENDFAWIEGVERAILAAAREERHAALTEAGSMLLESGEPNGIGCGTMVLALRDKE